MSRELVESGVDEIKISIDGADALEFNELRVGLNHQTVLSNVKHSGRSAMHTARDANYRCGHLPDFKSPADGSDARRHGRSDRIHRIAQLGRGAGHAPGRRIRKPCDRLWRTLTVLVNGDVSLCCLDYSGKEILGSAVHESGRHLEQRALPAIAAVAPQQPAGPDPAVQELFEVLFLRA